MEQIWAPWRIQYIQSDKSEGCILCDKPGENDDTTNYILYHGSSNYIILNSYPYNPGHLLITPYRHIGSIDLLNDEEQQEHIKIISRAVTVLKKKFVPNGFNIGANIGKTAGAGIEGHFHTHIVPRWDGDTNFSTVIFDIRIMPEILADSYQKLKGEF
ncbi:HIT domain-containing protein [Chloroflexota bacterium]